MKICPRCQRAYNDSTLSFCLEDGTPLVPAQTANSRDFAAPNKTGSSKLLLYLAGAVAGLFVVGLLAVVAIAAFLNRSQDTAANTQTTQTVNFNQSPRNANAADSNSINNNLITNANVAANPNSNLNSNAPANSTANANAAKPANSNANAAHETANANATTHHADNNLQKLVGTHGLTLQWIESSRPGQVSISKSGDDTLFISGTQSANGDYVTISGKIVEAEDRSFVFDGKVTTRVGYINDGQPCERSGKMTFRATGSRRYWRMQNMLNPCTKIETDYVDVYF